MADWKKELTGRVLVLVAHADDESVGYGALMQRMREATVVIATDCSPRDEYFWGKYGSREKYQEIRKEEARKAMALAKAKELVWLAEAEPKLEDQRLFLNLGAAYEQLEKVVQKVKPEAIATSAYEGGHPDHDSCNVLGAALSERYGMPVWEAPLYSRAYEGRGAVRGEPETREMWARRGKMRIQQFVCETVDDVALQLSPGEVETKRAMCQQYVSQGDFLQVFDAGRELVRPLASYMYEQAPHEGPANYEQWQWWMTAEEVSAKFAEFLGGAR